MTPSPGVLNAFQQYQARQAGLVEQQPTLRKLRPATAKLTDEKKHEIRRALRSGLTNVAVAKRFHVSKRSVVRIKANMRGDGLL